MEKLFIAYVSIASISCFLYPKTHWFRAKEPSTGMCVVFGLLWPYIWSVLAVLYMMDGREAK